jgi:hypothetical protein
MNNSSFHRKTKRKRIESKRAQEGSRGKEEIGDEEKLMSPKLLSKLVEE